MIGQIRKAHSDSYEVIFNGQTIKCTARGILRKSDKKPVVGDFVEIENTAITKILDRKNTFIRPSVANVDVIVVVVSPKPEPDFYLIDKMLINAYNKGVKIIFAVNKSDLGIDIVNDIREQYSGSNVEIISISALTKSGTEELKEKLNGKLTVFAGQSAVGKSSLINAMFGLNLRTGELSEKIQRGRHTTTHSEIHTCDGVSIIDSPGFAVIEAFVSAKDLKDFYPEFLEYSSGCKFRECTHTSEPNCQVKLAVSEGKLNSKRYERYLEIYKEILARR